MHAHQIETTTHVSRAVTPNRRRRAWVAVPVAMGALALVAACQPYGGTSNAASSAAAPSSSAAPAGGGAVIAPASTGLGMILVDAQGRTIYDFANDTGSTSTCNGECAHDWMPVAAPAAVPASVSGVPAELGSTKRDDGTQQLTVAGHPVYTFEGDSAPGQTNGNGIVLNGGLWTVVSPDGSPLAADRSSSGSSSSGY
jgi:predicted lipoprotein with Yx(FWY)xxD motif